MDDANGWRQHIAIVLANLQTQTAINAVYQLGLTLAQKEFNSAADFCFLAVNLLTGYNCFEPPINRFFNRNRSPQPSQVIFNLFIRKASDSGKTKTFFFFGSMPCFPTNYLTTKIIMRN